MVNYIEFDPGIDGKTVGQTLDKVPPVMRNIEHVARLQVDDVRTRLLNHRKHKHSRRFESRSPTKTNLIFGELFEVWSLDVDFAVHSGLFERNSTRIEKLTVLFGEQNPALPENQIV